MGNRFSSARALIAVWIPLLPPYALAGPLFPVLPLGTSSASSAGGGVGHAGGAGSLFENPGAMPVGAPFEAETGLMGLSSGLSPYFVFGASAGARSAYAIGYWYDARPGDPAHPLPARQGIRVGEAWEVLPWAVAGAAAQIVGIGAGPGDEGFGIDADLGLRARLGKAAALGVAARDLLESGLGPESGRPSRRSYLASLSMRLDGGGEGGGSFFERPEGEYALQARGLIPAGVLTHFLSLSAAFFPGGRLGLRGTAAWSQSGAPALAVALGTRLNFPMDRGELSVAYVFGNGPASLTGETGSAHSLSLGFRLNQTRDRTPPWVEVEADKPPGGPECGPEADSSRATPERCDFHFRLRAGDASGPNSEGGRIRAWALTVHAVDGKGALGAEARTFTGKELPPRSIRWNGSDSSGRKLPPGFYAYRLRAEDATGNSGTTDWRLLRIGGGEAPR